jgi:hypothetical protein
VKTAVLAQRHYSCYGIPDESHGCPEMGEVPLGSFCGTFPEIPAKRGGLIWFMKIKRNMEAGARVVRKSKGVGGTLVRIVK